MRFAEYRLRFRLLPFLFLAFAMPLFIYLGFWQLDRAEQKREQAQILTERTQLPALVLPSTLDDPEQLRFRQVTVVGEFERKDQFFIENRRYGGRTGFHVITPLRIGDSAQRVLVNRGWVPADAAGEPPLAKIPAGRIEVRGEADIPSPPALVLHGDPSVVKTWNNRWPYLTLELFAAKVDYPVYPVVMLQNPADPEGFVRNWPREMPKEGMHLGYAIQWFAFAVIALGIYLRLSIERTTNNGAARAC